MKDSSFNSRTLGRVRQTRSNSQNYRPMFQFAHPGKGATSSVRALFHEHIRFNSRTLGRVRLAECFRRWLLYLLVSIHAPWEGCDLLAFLLLMMNLFQFTHPGKGATQLWLDGDKEILVSIHAPWEGCDQGSRAWHGYPQRFNSRTLGRVRRPAWSVDYIAGSFNSRTLGRVRRHFGRSYDMNITRFNSRTLGRVRQCGAKLRIIGRINKRNLRLGVLS